MLVLAVLVLILFLALVAALSLWVRQSTQLRERIAFLERYAKDQGRTERAATRAWQEQCNEQRVLIKTLEGKLEVAEEAQGKVLDILEPLDQFRQACTGEESEELDPGDLVAWAVIQLGEVWVDALDKPPATAQTETPEGDSLFD